MQKFRSHKWDVGIQGCRINGGRINEGRLYYKISKLTWEIQTVQICQFFAEQLPVCLGNVNSSFYIYYLIAMEIIPALITLSLLGFTPAIAYKYVLV